MKKYTYVKLSTKGFLSSKIKSHRSIIDEYASRGYRYAGYIPTLHDLYGRVVEIDLIFEIDAEDIDDENN